MDIKKDILVKLQQGGNILNFQSQVATFEPYVPQPLIPNPKPSTKTTSEESTKGINSLLTNETVKLINTDGIPSDATAFYATMSKMGNNISTEDYYTVLSKVNQIKFNSDLFQKVSDDIRKKDSYDEYAVNNGKMIVMSADNKLLSITPEKYVENKEEYTPLTNKEVLSYRVSDTKYAFNNNLLEAVQSSVNPKEITEFLQGIVTKIAVQKNSNDEYTTPEQSKMISVIDGFKKGTITKEQAEGIQQELESSDSGYIYKQGISSESTRAHITETFSYIWSMMPKNYKDALKATAAVNTDDIEAGVQGLLYDYLTFNTFSNVSKKQSDLKYIGDDKKGSTDPSTSSSKEKETKITFAQRVMSGAAEQFNIDEQLNFGDGIGIKTKADIWNNIRDEKDNIVADVTTQYLINASLGQIGDISNMSLGGQKVSYEDLAHSVYTKGALTVSQLPYTTLVDGTIVPDFDIVKKKMKADEEINKLGDSVTDAQRDTIYRENGVNSNMFAEFITVPIYIDENDNYLSWGDDLSDNPYVEEVEDNDYVNDLFRNKFSTKDGKKVIKADIDDIYRGRLYMVKNASPGSVSRTMTIQGNPNDAGLVLEAKTKQQVKKEYEKNNKWNWNNN